MREQIEPWMLDSMIKSIRQRLVQVAAELMTGFWDTGVPFNLEERETVCGALDIAGIAYMKFDVLDSTQTVPPGHALIVGRAIDDVHRLWEITKRILVEHQKGGRGLSVIMVALSAELG